MKIKNEYYSARFADELIQFDSRYKDLKPKQLLSVSALIQNAYLGDNAKYKHAYNSDSVILTRDFLYENLGRNYLYFIEPIFHRFENSYNYQTGIASQNQLKQSFIEFRNSCGSNLSADSPLTDLHDSSGNIHRKPADRLPIDNLPRSIEALDIGKPFIPVNIRHIENSISFIDDAFNSFHTGAYIESDIITELTTLFLSLFNGNSKLKGSARRRLNRIYRALEGILDVSLNSTYGRGNLPISYKVTDAGRVSGIGTNHPQYIPREAKAIILHGTGWNEYDMENCHYSILAQITNEEVPAILRYLDNKKETRQRIEDDTGLTIKQVKTALISLIYGALTRKQGTIYRDVCNSDDHKYEALINHQLFKPMVNEVRKAGRDIISQLSYSVNQYGRTYRNVLGLKFTTKGKGTPRGANARKLLAHTLQGYEALALQVMTQANPESLRLYEYDGAVFSQNIDIEQAEYLIKKRAKIELKIAQKTTY